MLRLALLGDPVHHSLSPRFQNAALSTLGIEGHYEAIRCPPAELAGRLESLAKAGYRGLNLTVPLKEQAHALLAPQALTEDAAVAALGAVNTLRLEADGRWSLHNTDPTGFIQAAHCLTGASLSGLAIFLIGAGGAARAVAWACLRAGCSKVAVWNRGAERRAALLEALDDARLEPAELADGRCPGGFDLIVQASSLGLREGEPLPPLPAAGERPAALDLISHSTPWQAACAKAACPTADGREMLLGQGAAALRIWTDRQAPLAAMRSALDLPEI